MIDFLKQVDIKEEVLIEPDYKIRSMKELLDII